MPSRANQMGQFETERMDWQQYIQKPVWLHMFSLCVCMCVCVCFGMCFVFCTSILLSPVCTLSSPILLSPVFILSLYSCLSIHQSGLISLLLRETRPPQGGYLTCKQTHTDTHTQTHTHTHTGVCTCMQMPTHTLDTVPPAID